jgi:hypothetical protein
MLIIDLNETWKYLSKWKVWMPDHMPAAMSRTMVKKWANIKFSDGRLRMKPSSVKCKKSG